MNRVTDTTDLTVQQKAKLAFALTILREEQGIRGWHQWRHPEKGEPQILRLVRLSHGRIQQTWELDDARTHIDA